VPNTCISSNGTLVGISDRILGNLLAVKQELCGGKFELKVNDVVFVGHPKLLVDHGSGATTSLAPGSMDSAPALDTSHAPNKKTVKEVSTLTLFNVVFVLTAAASFEIRNCIHQLALSFAAALAHEERRCGFLTQQAKMMIAVYDEVTANSSAPSLSANAGPNSGIPRGGNVNAGSGADDASAGTSQETSPYAVMLTRCLLARNLSSALESLKKTGIVQMYVNDWIPISFCLPHKVHSRRTLESQGPLPSQQQKYQKPFKLSSILKALSSLQPYHALLPLEESEEILDHLPVDCSPALVRVVRVVSPLKKLETIATESDLALSQVFQIASHLVYWGKASIIYPLCENNVYVVSPKVGPESMSNHSRLSQNFFKLFGRNLQVTLSEFSLPIPLGDHQSPYARPQEQNDRVQMVMWLLQHKLLQQLHTYIYVLLSDLPDPPGMAVGGEHCRIKDDALAGFNQKSPLSLTDTASEKSDNVNSGGEGNGGLVNGGTIDESMKLRGKTQDILLSELTALERKAVFQLDVVNNSDDLKLFARLLRFFRGKQHIEEIMYYENISRSQILIILDKFRDVLVTTLHPDPVTSVFLD